MSVVTTVVPRTRRGVELVLLVFAVGIVLLAYANVGLAVDGSLPPSLLTYGLGLIVLVGAVHLLLRWRAAYADPVLLPIATVLNGLGLVMIHRLDLAEHRTGGGMAAKQLLWMTVGVVACLAVLWVVRDHRRLQRYTYTALAGGIGLLLLPLLPVIGKNINGSRIWIGIGPLSFQPGEIAKILLAMFFAGYLVQARDSLALVGRRFVGISLPRGRDLGPILVAWGFSLAVLVFERDLGSSLLYAPGSAAADPTSPTTPRATSSSPRSPRRSAWSACSRCSCSTCCSSSAACAPRSACATATASCSLPVWPSPWRCSASSSWEASPGSSRSPA